MANEKPNEVSGWKSELAALDSLPGETPLNKNGKWHRLENRLQQKQGRKRAVWYWAAASIVILLGISLWLTNQQPTTASPAFAIQSSVNKISLPNITIKPSNTPTIISGLSAKTAIPPTQKILLQQRDTRLNTMQTPAPIAIAETAMVAKVTPVVLPIDTQLVAITPTALPVKPKLKVVHLNELTDPSLFGTQLQTGDNYMVKEGRVINRPVYTTTSSATNQIRFNISSKKYSTN